MNAARSRAMLGNQNGAKKDHGTKEVLGKIWKFIDENPTTKSTTSITGKRLDMTHYRKSKHSVYGLPIKQSLVHSSNPSVHPFEPVRPSDLDDTTTANEVPEAIVATSRDRDVGTSGLENLLSNLVSGTTTFPTSSNFVYMPMAPGATYVASQHHHHHHGADFAGLDSLRERVQENSTDLHTMANRIGMTRTDLRTPDVDALAQQLAGVDIVSEVATGGTVASGTLQGVANAVGQGVGLLAEPDIETYVDTASLGDQALAEVSSNAVGDDEEVDRPTPFVELQLFQNEKILHLFDELKQAHDENDEEAIKSVETKIVRLRGTKKTDLQGALDELDQVYDEKAKKLDLVKQISEAQREAA